MRTSGGAAGAGGAGFFGLGVGVGVVGHFGCGVEVGAEEERDGASGGVGVCQRYMIYR